MASCVTRHTRSVRPCRSLSRARRRVRACALGDVVRVLRRS
jgi:hypothetical protein